MATVTFDPLAPFEVDGEQFDPAQDFSQESSAKFDPDQPFEIYDGQEYARDIAKSVVRGATAEGVQMAAEGVYRGLAENIAPVDRDLQLRQETQAAGQQLADVAANQALIPEAQAALTAGAQDRISAADQEAKARITPGTPQFEERMAAETSPQMQVADTLRTFANEASSQRQAVREALPVSPDVQASKIGQIAQGAGQLINAPAYLVPGVGPAMSISQLYQEGYDDYVNTKTQQGQEIDPAAANEAATSYAAISAPIDVLVDSLPAGRAISAMVGKAPIKEVVKEIGKIALAGGASEGFQQTVLNTIASQLSGYDPERPLTKDVWDSVIVGAAVSGAAATAAEGAGRASSPSVNPEDATKAVASTIVHDKAQQEAEVLSNNNAPLSAQAVKDNAAKVIQEINTNEPITISAPNSNQVVIGGDERFAPPAVEKTVSALPITATVPPIPKTLDVGSREINELEIEENLQPQNQENWVVAPDVPYFRTQKGSVYEIDGNSTRRTKAKGIKEKDDGLKDASEVTVYVSNQGGRDMAMFQSLSANGRRIQLDPDTNTIQGTYPNERTGKRKGGTYAYRYSTTPQVGLVPVELWKSAEDGYRGWHPGHPIIEISNPERAVAAAYLTNKGRQIVAPTHAQAFDLVESGQLQLDPDENINENVEGFVTNTGRFVNRQEAATLNQVTNSYQGEGQMGSKDLMLPAERAAYDTRTQSLNEQQSTGAQPPASNQEQAIIPQEGVPPEGEEGSQTAETQIGEPNATKAIQQQESVPTEPQKRIEGGKTEIPSTSDQLRSSTEGQEVAPLSSNNNENTESTNSGGVRETIQPPVAESQAIPSEGQNQPPQRVQIGSSPQPYEVLGPLPQTEVEKKLGEQYFQVRNERTGQEQVVEKNDMRAIGAKLGPGAANIEEPLTQYEERSFGQRLDADEALDPTLRENIGDKYYTPIPNNITAAQAREIITERGIDDTISVIRDENNGIPFHVRSVLGQTIIRNLNQQYTALKESNPQEAQKVLDKTVELAEWQQDFGTRLGQGVQSFAMWSRLTPEGMLLTYQKGVKKARERYEQANPGEVGAIINAINKAVPKDKAAVIDDHASKGNKTAKKVKKATEKIIKAGKGKDLTSPEFYEAVSTELGLPKVSPEISTKILDLAEKVAGAAEGIPKDRATLALTKYIATQKGFQPSDLPLGIYYGNILSGYNTHLVNAVDTLGNVNSEIFGLALTDPKAATKIYGALLRGFSEGKADALMALTEGRIATDEKWMDVPKLMEVAKFGTKGGVPIDTSTKGGQIVKMIGESKIATPLNLYKYVGRALSATDAFNFRGAKEAKAAALAYKMAVNEGKKGSDIDTRMNEILGLDKMSGLLAQAKAEGFEGQQAVARAVELREELRDSGISDASSEFAGEATYNHKPHGALGIVANGIESVSNKLLPLKLFVPFTRIVANVTNRSLNYTPYGYKRAFMGYTGEGGPPIGDARLQAIARANIGTTGLALLGMLAAQGIIEINGAGPSDDEKRKQLLSAGWKPYSIKIGDTYWNYLLTPLGLGLSVIGNMVDSQKYNELGNKDAATRAVYALGRIGSTVASQSFISGLSGLFKMLSDAPGEAVSAIKGMISSTTSGFTTPTLIRDVNRVFDNRLYQSDGIAGDFIKNTPFAGLALKPALNALGEPVTLPRQRFFTALKDDPAWRTIAEAGLRIPVPSKATAAKPGQPGALSSTQYYNYLKESGQEMKKYIIKNEARLRSKNQEDAQELLKKEAERVHKRILPRIRREQYANP